MAGMLDALEPRAALAEIARDFHARGWMSGTAGNLSARVDAEHFWITASNKPKGRLDKDDFLLVRVADAFVVERRRADDKPSAETAIHAALYRQFDEARACLHGHTVSACLAAERAKKGATSLRLPAIEMIKGFNIWQQNPKVDLPLFDNTLDVAKIAKAVAQRFRKVAPAVTALMIRGHGPTVWGAGLQEAYNRFEILDFLLEYTAKRGVR
jgi:methylthioribulose-1-phosphate dehydratase